MAAYILRITYQNNTVRNIPLTRLVAVPSERGAKYQLLDEATRKPVEGTVLKQKGENLIVEVQHQAVVHVNRFYQDGMQTQFVNADTSPASSTPISQPEAPPPTTVSHDTNTNSLSLPSFDLGGNMQPILLGGAALGGLAALANSGKKGSSDTSTPPSNALNYTVQGTVMAGAVLKDNQLQVVLSKADGTIIATVKVAEGGKFSASVGSYTGVVIAKVVDGGNGADYQDEASNQAKSLSSNLYAAGVLTAQGILTLNVNPLTTVAYNEAKAIKLDEDTIKQVNSAVAKVFNVGDLHTTNVILVTDAQYQASGSAGENYGAVLAMLSGADKLNNASTPQDTINKLNEHLTITGNVASLTSTAQTLLSEGAKEYNKQAPAEKKAVLLDTYPPEITSVANVSLDENTGANQLVYKATALDTSSVSYSLKETASAFSINANTGEVRLIANPDFETQNKYSFTVVATDSAANRSEKAVSLTINNKDEKPPIITSATQTQLAEKSGANQLVYTILANDDSSDMSSEPLSYSLKNINNVSEHFLIEANKVSLKDNPNYDTQSSYQFTVIATDTAGNSSEQAINLAILERTPPKITSITLAGPNQARDTWKAGDVIQADVVMSEPVSVTGTPQLTLHIGNSDVSAAFSAVNQATLTFKYTLLADQSDTNGISVAANSLALNGGTIQDLAGNAADLAHTPLADNPTLKVDSTPPTLSLLNSTPEINSSDNVSLQSNELGKAYLLHSSITVNSLADIQNAADNKVNIVDISSTNSATNLAATGLIAGKYRLYAQDSAGNLSAPASQEVTIKSINSVALTSKSSTGEQALVAGDSVFITVQTDHNVVVTGTPQLLLNIGGITQKADYDSTRSSATSLVFKYTIQLGDTDSDGIAIADNSLILNGATIQDSLGNPAELVHSAVADNAGYKVDAPETSVTGNVLIGKILAAHQLNVTLSKPDGSLLKQVAVAADGSFSAKLGAYAGLVVAQLTDQDVGVDYVDEATQANKDLSTNLFALGNVTAGGSLVLNINPITTLAYNKTLAAGLTTDNLTAVNTALNSLLQLDNLTQTNPVLASNSTYNSADGLSAAERYGSYLDALAGAEQLNSGLQYVIDQLTNTIVINGSTGSLSASGQDLLLKGANSYNTSNSSKPIPNIDIFKPVFSSTGTATSIDENSGADQIIYQAAATDGSSVSYSLKDTPANLVIDSSTGAVKLTVNPDFETQANYAFTVIAKDAANNSAELPVTLAIKDIAEPNQLSVVVSGTTGIQKAGNVLTLTVNSSNDAITVDTTQGKPQLGLNIGGTTVWADYQSGSGSKSLVFTYTIVAGLSDDDGISIDANSLQARGATLKDSKGQDIKLEHPAVTNQANFKVDALAPDTKLANSYPQLELDSATPGVDKTPHLSALGTGGEFVATWVGQDSNGDNAIWVQKFSAKGLAVGPQVKLEAIAQGTDSTPQVTALGDSGRFVVVWSGQNDTGFSHIYSQKFNADGSITGLAMQAVSASSSDSIGNAVEPRVTQVGSGDEFVVGWWINVAGKPSAAYVQKFDADGFALSNTLQRLDTSINARGGATQLAKLANTGEFVAVWTGADSGAVTDQSIYVQKFNADGTPQGSSSQLEATGKTDGRDEQPQIVALDNSAFALVWQGDDANADKSIFVQTFAADGKPVLSNPVKLEALGNTAGADFSPQIIHIAGGFVVAFTGEHSSGGGSSIFVQRFNTDGSLAGSMTQLAAPNSPNTSNISPALQALGQGNNDGYAVTWVGIDSGTDQSVYLQKFNHDGTLAGNITLLESASNNHAADINPQLISIVNQGEFVVSWEGLDSQDDSSIFIQKFSSAASRNADVYTSNTGNVTLHSSEISKAYLVNSSINVKALTDITAADASLWREVNITTANSDTSVSTTGLPVGNYAVYGVDAAGNLSQASNRLILDNSAAKIQSVTFANGIGASNKLLNTGDIVNVQVKFDEAVNVTGTAQLALVIGTDTVQAQYVATHDANTLTFQYTIQAGQTDTDGISITSNALTGTIKDNAGNSADLNHAAVAANVNNNVDTSAPSVTVTGNNVSSSEIGTAYLVDSHLSVSKLSDIRYAADNAWNQVTISASNTPVALDNTGLLDGSYKVYSADAAGNLSSAASQTISVENAAPFITSLKLANSNGILNTGDTVTILLNMSETVTVTGSPQLAVQVGSDTTQAVYDAAQSSADILAFKYTVLANQQDSDGISIASNALSLNGGTIQDSASKNAVLTHSALANNINYSVDAVAPQFTSSSTAAVDENIGINKLVYTAQATDNLAIKYSLKAAVGDVAKFSITEQTGQVTLSESPDYETKPSYNFTVVATDAAGNSSEQAVALNINNLSNEPQANIVIFDLVSGVSSNHSGRNFSADKSYNIYIRVDGSTSNLTTHTDSTWGKWTGAQNLGTDDKVILVGNGAVIKGANQKTISQLKLTARTMEWRTGNTSNKLAARLMASGTLVRIDVNHTKDLWDGSRPQLNAAVLNTAYLTQIPNGLLNSQGLV